MSSPKSSGSYQALPAEQVFDWLDTESDQRAARGQVRRLHPRAAETTGLDLAGNDYLGLAGDKRVAGAAAAAALRWGGPSSSRLATGTTETHIELERELAAFHGAAAALVFSSGLAANLGAVTALSGAESAIVADRHLHPSLADATRLSRADVAAVTHADQAATAHALATRRQQRALVVTDSVFGADGDLAPLPGLSTVCRQHGAALLVDDTHGFGVLGEGGRGAVHEASLAAEPDIITTLDLSATLGVQGGAVLGPKRVIDHLVNTARSFVFDSALAPADVAAARTALGILRDEPDLPRHAANNAAALAEGLRAAGLRVGIPDAAIVSVHAPGAEEAVSWAARCTSQGVGVSSDRPPVVPDGASRLRLAARSDLGEQDIATAVNTISETAPPGAHG